MDWIPINQSAKHQSQEKLCLTDSILFFFFGGGGGGGVKCIVRCGAGVEGYNGILDT